MNYPLPRMATRGRPRDYETDRIGGMLRALAAFRSDGELELSPRMSAFNAGIGMRAQRGPFDSTMSMPLETLAASRDLDATSGAALSGAPRVDGAPTLRDFSIVLDAGARFVTVPAAGDMGVPSVQTAPVAEWLQEGDVLTESDPVFGLTEPEARRLAVGFFVSWRLFSSSGAMIDRLLSAEISAALGRGIDAAVLGGSGTGGEPTGLDTLSGVNDSTGTSLAHGGLLEMRRTALAAGAREDRLTWIGAPAVQELLGSRERSSGGGRYLWDDVGVLGRRAFATSSAPASTLLVGDFTGVTIYARDRVDIRVDRRPLATSGKVRVVADVYLDVAVPHPGAFSRATSIT